MKPVEFAQRVIEDYVKNQTKFEDEVDIEGIDVKTAGVFVSIKTKEGDLRGCIGTIIATKNNIKEEIQQNAISASTQDPRFEPIQPEELNDLVISVDILHKPKQVKSLEELDPNTYGIIVRSKNNRQALLLPMLEGIDTVEKQVSICMNKADIPQNTPVSIQKFKVNRYYE